jgi:hyperpolarization activated cyclic nucleotide-gated potassium channel 4
MADKIGNTPLIEAIKGSHTHVVRILRNAGAIFTEPNAGEHLRNGVWNGHLDFVTALLQNGANPNSADRSGRTALHIAISQGMVSMAKRLIDHGANVYAQDR